MDWPFNHHSKTRPTVFPVRLWSLAFLTLVFGFLNNVNPVVVADSSPPVADVEDLFKDEGFLRMSRGGEAFGRRPPPPPLILNPPHLSTQPPARQFPTPLPFPKEKGRVPSAPPQQRNDQISASGEKGSLENVNSNLANRSHNRNRGTKSDVDKVGSDEGGNGGLKPTGLDANGHQSSRGLEKDGNGVFSKVSPAGVNSGTSGAASSSSGDTGGESDAHPLLGITPAAPGEAFDFNPILSNPAVTRILAGSSGRIPQWEPALPDLHDLIPEVNYTTDVLNRGYPHSHNPQVHQHPSATNDNSHSGSPSGGSGTSYNNNNNGGFLGSSNGISSGTNSNSNNLSGNNGHGAVFNPKNPVFVPSPVSSKGSSTMYNMDQLTNNIAIPKHTLPNPSNLATSRSTVLDDGSDANNGGGGSNNNYGGNNQGSGVGISGSSSGEDTDRDNGNSHHDRYPPSSGSIGSSNHLDGSRGEGGGPYFYDEDDSGLSEDSARSHVATNSNDAQGKRGIWKETGSGHPGQEHLDSRDENGPKYIVCDALCGAWKHQCKLMGILFSITSVLCLVFAIAILYSLQFSIRDFVPFSIILLLLFTTSASRAFILLSGWLCSPDSRPTWLPIISTLPAALFVITILVALHLARFPFPFIKSYTIPCYMILIISSVALGPPLSLSLGAHFHPYNHGILSQVAWIFGHVILALMSLAYLLKFKPFYVRLANERGNVNANGGNSNTMNGGNSLSHGGGTPAVVANGSSNLSSLKKRGYVVKWGCLQARAMFGASLLALCLSTMIIISVAMGRGECEATSTWTGWVLSLCARMLEFAIVILLLLVTISSADIRFISRLTRVPINKSNVGLINADIFPTMVSSNTAVQRCIPMYSSNTRADVMMLGPTESRSSLRGKTFGERALPGERLGEYRSSVGRGLPLRLGSGGPSHSLPGTPVDGFPQGLKLPEPAPASLLVTKVVFGTPAKSREVNLSHQHENPLLCTGGGPGSKDDRETNNIYASLESVKIAPFVNAGSSTGSNHSGSDRVLLSAPRDYIYSISRDLTKTIDSIYDTSRPRGNNLAHTIETLCPPLAHTIEQIGSIPNLSSNQPGRGGSSASGAGASFNLHPHNLHHSHGNSIAAGRTDLARTIDRIRYAAAAGAPSASLTAPGNNHAGRNFVLQLGTPGSSHLPGMGNPPPYCSSESSHDVTPDSGIVSDIHLKNGRDVPEVVYAREYRGNSVEDIRRLPMLPLPKQQHRGPGATPLYDKTPTSPNNPSCAPSPAALRPGTSPLYVPTPTSNNTIVGCVEHLLNQTEHILSRTESLDSNSHSAGLQRLLNHKEQLEHVEKLLAQAEYAIWLEKRNVSQLGSNESPSPYGFSHRPVSNANSVASASFSSANSANPVQSSMRKETPINPLSSGSSGNPMIVNNHGNSISSGGAPSIGQSSKKISKNLEEESVV